LIDLLKRFLQSEIEVILAAANLWRNNCEIGK